MQNSTTIARTPQVGHAPEHLIAVVALGNTLRGDDGVAAALLTALPNDLKRQLCMLDAGSYTRDLPEFLSGHSVGIIIDAIDCQSAQPLTVIDLYEVCDSQSVAVDCCHALSWVDELILYKDMVALPERLVFVGVQTYNTGWHHALSPELEKKLPSICRSLTEIIAQELKTCTKQP